MAAAISRRSTLRLLKQFQSSSPSSFVSQNPNCPSSFLESHPKPIINHSACTKPNSSQFMMFRFESPRFFCNNPQQHERDFSALANEITDVFEDAKKKLYRLYPLLMADSLISLSVNWYLTGSAGLEIPTEIVQLFAPALLLRWSSFPMNYLFEVMKSVMEMAREQGRPQYLTGMLQALKKFVEILNISSVVFRGLVYCKAVILGACMLYWALNKQSETKEEVVEVVDF